MITSDNWKDLVCLQDVKHDLPSDIPINVFYMRTYKQNGGVTISVEKERVPRALINLSEEALIKVLNGLVNQFPIVHISNNDQLIAEKNKIATRTRRGKANRNIDNLWFYRGNSSIDGPIVVLEWQGKFTVFTVPNFTDYAFRVQEDI